jgi:hypothetical protein
MLSGRLIPKAEGTKLLSGQWRGLHRRKLGISLPIFLLALILALLAPAAGAGTEGRVLLTVDCAQSSGQLSPYFFGVVSGPFYDAEGLALCKQAGFQLMEVLHDMAEEPSGGPGQPPRPPMGQREGPPPFGERGGPPFPGPPPPWLRQEAGPGPMHRPNSFGEVKRWVDACSRLKMAVMPAFIILGPPRDEEGFQRRITAEVKELQQIAARHQTRIRLFRFGCEPDLREFWHGTPEQFYHTYKLWVQAVKATDPQAIAVAPGFAAIESRPRAEPMGQCVKDFVDYCHRQQVPLDMLAIHGYGLDPEFSFGLPARAVGEYLRQFPRLSPIFGVARVADNEWNIPSRYPENVNPIFATAWAAAHNVAALIQMLKNGVQLTVRLGGCSTAPPELRRGQQEVENLLVNSDRSKRPAYFGLAGINRFVNFPYQVLSKSNNRNYEILAGFSPRKDQLYIAISHLPIERLMEKERNLKILHPMEERYIRQRTAQNPDSSQYALKIGQLPFSAKGKVRLRRYRVDEKTNGSLVEDRQMANVKGIDLQQNLSGPGVDFILLEPAD